MMNCNHDFDDLVLFQAGELPGSSAREVLKRLGTCSACRLELDRLILLVDQEAVEYAIDEDALSGARARAYAQIGQTWRVRSHQIGSALRGYLDRLRPLPQVALAVLLVAVGYGIGSRGSQPDEGLASMPDPEIFDVRDIEFDPMTGQAFIRFDRLQEAAVAGPLDDVQIRTVIRSALDQPDDARIRLHALRTVSQLGESAAGDAELEEAVIRIVESENSDALRLRAVRALGAIYRGMDLPGEARRALLDALSAEVGVGVRVAALEVLMEHQPLAEDADVLRRVSNSDPNPYIRLGAASSLERLESGPLEQLD